MFGRPKPNIEIRITYTIDGVRVKSDGRLHIHGVGGGLPRAIDDLYEDFMADMRGLFNPTGERNDDEQDGELRQLAKPAPAKSGPFSVSIMGEGREDTIWLEWRDRSLTHFWCADADAIRAFRDVCNAALASQGEE